MLVGLGVGKCYIGFNFIQRMSDVYGGKNAAAHKKLSE